MLDPQLSEQLRGYLQKLQRPVVITANTDDSARSHQMLEMLEQIESLSSLVSLERQRDSNLRAPSFALGSPGRDIHLRFAGIPLGHEFTSLVLALLQVGGHPPKLEADKLAQLSQLPGPLRFETYYSPSCQNCPDVVQALNLLAVLNPAVEHVAIDGAAFEDEVTRREVMSVPSVYLNGEAWGSGRMGVDEILARLDSGAAAREAEKLKHKAPYDMLIVGGGPAGAAAAVYAARKGIRTGLVAERFGGQVMDTLAIENFISVPATQGPKMVAALEQHVSDYDVDIMTLQRASALREAGEHIEVELDSGATLAARSLIIATGARWRQMNVPGEQAYRNRGVAYCPHCDGPLFKGKPVAVIGGGNSGVEAAIDLAGIVSEVTLIEFDQRLRADAVLQRKLRSLANVRVITSARTTEVLGDGRKVTGLRYEDRRDGSMQELRLDGIFVQIGLLPNSEWLADSLALSPRGEIMVDERGATSLPGVFAAGDVTTAPYKQIIVSMGSGATAALGAFDHLMRSGTDGEAREAA